MPQFSRRSRFSWQTQREEQGPQVLAKLRLSAQSHTPPRSFAASQESIPLAEVAGAAAKTRFPRLVELSRRSPPSCWSDRRSHKISIPICPSHRRFLIRAQHRSLLPRMATDTNSPGPGKGRGIGSKDGNNLGDNGDGPAGDGTGKGPYVPGLFP